ncbi:MAG: hypothetical protein V5A61_13235 [Haloarculaceae archaeon]
MGRGILGLVGLAVTLAFAIPVGLLGLDMLTKGDTLIGGGFVAFAVLMVVLQEYLTTPGDVPGRVAGRLVGSVAKEPESDPDGGSGSAGERE